MKDLLATYFVSGTMLGAREIKYNKEVYRQLRMILI